MLGFGALSEFPIGAIPVVGGGGTSLACPTPTNITTTEPIPSLVQVINLQAPVPTGVAVSGAAPKLTISLGVPVGRTNYVTYSTDAGASGTVGNGGTGALPTKTTGFVAHDGLVHAFRLQLAQGAGTTSGDYSYMYLANATLDAGDVGKTFSYSIWGKSNTGSNQDIYFFPVGISASTSIITLTPEWQKFTWTGDVNQTIITGMPCLYGGYTPANSTADVLLAYPQCVAGSDTGAVIMTTSVPVTEASLSITEFLPTLSQGASLFCPTPASLTTSGWTPTVQRNLAAPAPTGMATAKPLPTLAVTLQAPAPTGMATAKPLPTRSQDVLGVAPVALITEKPSPTLGMSLLAAAAAVIFATFAPTLSQTVSLVCPAPTNITTTEPAPTLVQTINLQAPAPTAIALGTPAPSLLSGTVLACPAPVTIVTAKPTPTVQIGLQAPVPQTIQTNTPAGTIQIALACPSPTGIASAKPAPTLARSLVCPAPTATTLAKPLPALQVALGAPTRTLATSATPATLQATLRPAAAAPTLGTPTPTVEILGPLEIDPDFLVVARKVHHIHATYRAEVLRAATIRVYSKKARATIFNNVAASRVYKVVV